MGRIRVLSDNVANKIAAGEVVERPASVVKELLENALDAGASEIRIDAENAGRRLLRIQDDGSGMLRDDALLAFERHATSKISDVRDLLGIATLGFRGEALPSIASVSRLTLETRSSEERIGTSIEIHGGKLLRCDEAARTRGTTIAVRDLFYNVPARKKFLRSDQTELAHIGSLLTHYSLGHPQLRFELFHEGRELLDVTPVESVRERAFQVFGAETLDELVEVPIANLRLPELEEAEFELEGLVSGPHVQKSNRNSIFLFVNGRLIRDKVLLHALQSAYHNLMPAGCYPFSLLFLRCSPEEVDVNVHPAKTEVRFRHSSPVHDFVRDTLRSVLMQSRPVSRLPLPVSPVLPREPFQLTHPERIGQAAALPFSEFTAAMESLESEPADTEERSAHNETEPIITVPGTPRLAVNMPAVTTSPAPAATATASAPSLNGRTRRVPETHGGLDHLPAEWERADSLAALPHLRPLGQLHDSFIIATSRDGLWIIDQHVAHERVLFEQVLRQRSAGAVEMQQLLMPLVIQLTPAQNLEYARIEGELSAHGFESEPFGHRTVAIKAAPAAVGPADIEKVVLEILEIAETELRSASLEDIRSSVCATIACRAAIKINTRLETAKMEWLLRALSDCEYPMTCPHGRPIALRYATRDILKSFHRV